jgi:hypothetical protein
MHLNYLFPGQEISFVFYIIRQGLQKELAIAKSHVVPSSGMKPASARWEKVPIPDTKLAGLPGRNQACHIGMRLQQMTVVVAVRPPERRLLSTVSRPPHNAETAGARTTCLYSLFHIPS